MKVTKQELIKFLDEEVLIPVETNPKATETIKLKVYGKG